MVTVVHGSDSETADMADRTVQEVQAAYQHVFNIDDNAIAKINGKQVDAGHIVEDGDKVVFEKDARKAT